jgi:hypothetical protein
MARRRVVDGTNLLYVLDSGNDRMLSCAALNTSKLTRLRVQRASALIAIA